MKVEFKLPELGENIERGDVVRLMVREGQTVEPNDGVLELETDKAVVEIPCSQGGKITKVHVKQGDTIQVGQTLLTLETDAAEAPGAVEKQTPAPAESKSQGKAREAPKATPQAQASLQEEPTPTETRRIAAEVTETGAREAKHKAPTPPAAEPTFGAPIPAGPAARRLAREHGVDLRQVVGTGERGRITPEDVQAATHSASAAAVGEPAVPPGEPGHDAWGQVRREKMPRIRQTIAAQMVRSATTIPHVTNFDDADVTELEQFRKGVPAGFLGENVKLTLMPFVIKAVALALRQHPLLNASFDEQNEQVVYKQYVNVGVAVDTPRGLVVPALRNADRMSIAQIARELTNLAQRARAAQFTIEELRGGTFTISNLGAVGGTYSTPIINHPEVAILLLGRSRWMPVVRDEAEGRIEPRLLLPLSLSYDHRLVDGATAGRYLNEVIQSLQSPGKLLLMG